MVLDYYEKDLLKIQQKVSYRHMYVHIPAATIYIITLRVSYE